MSMDIKVPAGKYIVAVSGGVDSIALLDLLSRKSSLELVVAHFNHGIRADSALDKELVIKAADKYNLPVEVGYGDLGKNSSEELARRKRYEFLEAVANKHQGQEIITAHHQDDLIETALINILRGSGPKGLIAISVNKKVLRPLINTPKREIVAYANKHHLNWREDTTNKDVKYLRNYIRHNILTHLSDKDRYSLLKNIDNVAKIDKQKVKLSATMSRLIMKDQKIDRSKFNLLPSEVANEMMVYWLRGSGLKDFDKRTIERLTLAIKLAAPGTKHPAKNGLWLKVDTKAAQIMGSS